MVSYYVCSCEVHSCILVRSPCQKGSHLLITEELFHMASLYAWPTCEVHICILVRSLWSILKRQTLIQRKRNQHFHLNNWNYPYQTLLNYLTDASTSFCFKLDSRLISEQSWSKELRACCIVSSGLWWRSLGLG